MQVALCSLLLLFLSVCVCVFFLISLCRSTCNVYSFLCVAKRQMLVILFRFCFLLFVFWWKTKNKDTFLKGFLFLNCLHSGNKIVMMGVRNVCLSYNFFLLFFFIFFFYFFFLMIVLLESLTLLYCCWLFTHLMSC